MQEKHFAPCVGVNNIDCETQENEREVAPFFCASRGNVDRLGTSRPRGGRWVGGGVLKCSHVVCSLGDTFPRPKEVEHSGATRARYGSRYICCLTSL